ncbi:MAG: 2Fe-2S iron-sulfur cluster-binding protein, partial [Thermofilum sp.]
MAKIILEPEGKRIPAHRGQTLLQVLRDTGVILESLCGGFGACGKDKVLIVRGQESLNPLTRSEEKFLTLDEARKGYRLACQARIIEDGDIVVFVPPESRAKPTQRKIVSEGYMRNVTLDPLVKRIKVVLRAPSLEDPRSDYERLADTLRKVLETNDVKASLDVLRDLPNKARNSNWSLSLVLWGN